MDRYLHDSHVLSLNAENCSMRSRKTAAEGQSLKLITIAFASMLTGAFIAEHERTFGKRNAVLDVVNFLDRLSFKHMHRACRNPTPPSVPPCAKLVASPLHLKTIQQSRANGADASWPSYNNTRCKSLLMPSRYPRKAMRTIWQRSR